MKKVLIAVTVCTFVSISIAARSFLWQRTTSEMIDIMEPIANAVLNNSIDLRTECDILDLPRGTQRSFGRYLYKGYKRMLKASEYDTDDVQYKKNFLRADRNFMAAHHRMSRFFMRHCEPEDDGSFTNWGLIRGIFYLARKAKFNPVSYKRNVAD